MIRNGFDEGLTLETSAFESLYGGQFTLSTQLIKPNYTRYSFRLVPTSKILIGNFKNRHVLCTSLFCSQVFKAMSNVLNSDVNVVSIALIAFYSLAVTNLAHWATSSLNKLSTGQRPTRE